jgi:hypothetical protein
LATGMRIGFGKSAPKETRRASQVFSSHQLTAPQTRGAEHGAFRCGGRLGQGGKRGCRVIIRWGSSRSCLREEESESVVQRLNGRLHCKAVRHQGSAVKGFENRLASWAAVFPRSAAL